MFRSAPFRTELGATWRLAWPIALANLGRQLLGLVDSAVVGRLGEVPLGAVGLGNGILFAIVVLGVGTMLGLDPLVAQAVGAGERRRARSLLWQGGWLGLLLALPLAAITAATALSLEVLGIEAEMAAETTRYVMARLPGVPLFLLFVGARSYLQAHDLTKPMLVAVAAANLVNLPLSWTLVFGDAGLAPLGIPPVGIPALGTAGAGWASSFAILLQLSIVFVAIRWMPVEVAPGARRPHLPTMWKAFRLGIAAGTALLAEVGLFAIVAFLMGIMGSLPLAAHNVALNWVATTFQIPQAIGAAAAVRVAQAIGRGDALGTRRAGWAAFLLGAGVMTAASLAFVGFPRALSRVITDQAAVIELAVPLLWVAAAFQIADGIQAIGAGALRGAGDTRFAMVANLIGHYAIGLPVGIGLAWGVDWGPVGLWGALSAGLTTVAVALTWRFARLSRRDLKRV